MASALTLTIGREYGYVLAVLVAALLVHHVWMVQIVVGARKKYGVKYPDLYADKSHQHATEFNCVQRGHQNSLENLPQFLALLLAAGVRHPLTAAISGAVYLLGRIFYMQGYASGKPNKRQQGAFMYFGLLALLGIAGKFAFELITMK